MSIWEEEKEEIGEEEEEEEEEGKKQESLSTYSCVLLLLCVLSYLLCAFNQRTFPLSIIFFSFSHPPTYLPFPPSTHLH